MEVKRQVPKYAPEDPRHDFDYWFVQFNMEVVADFMIGGDVLELGCFAGLSTSLLLERAKTMTVVDLSQENLDLTREKLDAEGKGAALIRSAWEEYVPDSQFSDVMFWRGLEHLVDPVAMLRAIRGWLAPGGRLHVVVPNALSLHRRIGVQMGMLRDVHELNDRDREVGHQRVYDRQILSRQLDDAGFDVHHWEGMYLKPLSNGQMLEWDERLIRAYFAMGRELPDYCAEIYVCAVPRS